jgi:hypothetical protein
MATPMTCSGGITRGMITEKQKNVRKNHSRFRKNPIHIAGFPTATPVRLTLLGGGNGGLYIVGWTGTQWKG